MLTQTFTSAPLPPHLCFIKSSCFHTPEAYHSSSSALPSHILNLPSSHSCTNGFLSPQLTNFMLVQTLDLALLIYTILMNPHPLLIISTTYNAYIPTLPSHILN
ncbi:hypothetical protein O181_017661 [Austropuccinia psidii MF-1]|uniref:Uncharacterized protein n=1 Tax=Austropuccinia psidii MF-1 TaxID=1389203 RepID=A0A9Q3C3T4_9BASI|nr:hypothetical protein [Austropuccinia psidii MF-1]